MKLLLLAVGVWLIGLGIALILVDVAAGHSTYCGHRSKIVEVDVNVFDRFKFHHQDNFQGEHWHFYLHQRLMSDGSWFSMHGYWRRCE